ncbi:MFS transporter [Pseudonocardia sp. S2-4]|uniref:MFS transporter n=2 Tax=Pseudonocardia humida TaxID=2800819 RepID=A0ABT1A3A7_9PSEU|nr:MFS transporter [Pseudonocardia humida]
MAAHAANALGDGSFHVTSALFFAQVVGLSAAQTGLCLTLAWTAGFLLTTPLGLLADRIGLRRSAVLWSLVIAAALVAVAVSGLRDPVPFTALIALYAVAQSALAATRQALVATTIAPERRVTVRARLHVAVNTGLGLGAGLGGLALLVGTPTAFLAVFVFDALTFLVAAAVIARLPRPTAQVSAAAPRSLRLDVLRDRRYVVAAALTAVLYLYMPMLTVALPLFIAQRTAAPGWSIALLFVVNTIGVLLVQVRAARTVHSLPSAAVALRRAGLVLLVSCLVMAGSAATDSAAVALSVLVVGAVLQVLGEVVLAAASWHVGFALADPDRPGQWQGLWSSGQPLARAVGPVVLTALLLSWSGPGWLVLGGVFAGVGLLLAAVVTRAARAGSPPIPLAA